jgi:hypothetical protein
LFVVAGHFHIGLYCKDMSDYVFPGYSESKFSTSFRVFLGSIQGHAGAANNDVLEQLCQLSNDLDTLDPSRIINQAQLCLVEEGEHLGPRTWNLERDLLFSICSKALALGDGMSPPSLMADQVRSILGEWNLCLRTFVDELGAIIAANGSVLNN